MSTARFPTSTRPDDGRFHGGAKITLVEGTRHPDPPPPPAHLSKRERELYREAWAEPSRPCGAAPTRPGSPAGQGWRRNSRLSLPRVLFLWTSGAKRCRRCGPGIARRGSRRNGSGQEAGSRSKPGGLCDYEMASSSLVRPPSASLIVRSLSKPPVSPHNSRNASARFWRPESPICRRLRADRRTRRALLLRERQRGEASAAGMPLSR